MTEHVEFEVRYDGDEMVIIGVPLIGPEADAMSRARNQAFWAVASEYRNQFTDLEKIEVRELGTDEPWWNPSQEFPARV